MSLTIIEVKNAKPAASDYRLADSHGLFLHITTAGGKIWRYRYRVGPREKTLTLGRYPEMGLVAAREAHHEARKMVSEGKDPALEKQKSKISRIEAAKITFRKVAEDWLADQEPIWSISNAKRVRNRFERDLYPLFGNLPIGQVESTAILRALRKIEARGSIETAKRVRGYVRSVFRRAKGERLVDHALLLEIDEIKDALKPARRGSKQPALTEVPELLEFQNVVDRSTSSLVVKLASRLLALTLVRIGVLRAALWTEIEGIDWDSPNSVPNAPIWRIPASRMKLDVEDKGNPAFGHDVPLPHQAVEVLRALRPLTGCFDLLFPSTKSWREPMSDAALSTVYKRMGGGRYKNVMVPHGWRSSFSTIMNERAAELERDGDRMVIDMVLAHVPPGVSASEWSYNRSRYRKPRGTLIQIWADMITRGLLPAEEMVTCYLSGNQRDRQ
ncbi:integrase arm-type DNA-binding domain-containing protein [Sphingobium sp. H39-3-25]|uniref:tyrosine-type recombinase/integrase n=1 Tax=Sphingobium arseniciresistens TaxID=3030834 RepID=UPI0023B903D7|nr:integrase arm-type DNA-binding domain-containing protein [Sphingobium arseniciresistens]